MTREQLAQWCAEVVDPTRALADDIARHTRGTVTDEGEHWRISTPLENCKAAYDRRERLLKEIQQANRELAGNIRKARQTHSLAVIAQELGVSRQRVHQISQND